MTVGDLIRELQGMPGHWPVHVETAEDGSGDIAYRYLLDVQRDNFPRRGNMAVIRLARPEEVA